MDDAEFRKYVEALGAAMNAATVDEEGSLGLDIPLDEGRHQRVFLGLVKDAFERPMLAAYTPIGDAEDVDPVAALELNSTSAYGALAFLDGKVVMRRTERLAGLEPKGFAESLQLLALNADLIEQTLYGRRDRY